MKAREQLDRLRTAIDDTVEWMNGYGFQDAEDEEKNPLEAPLQLLIDTIEAHDVMTESCDRDGQECCDCLDRAVKSALAALASNPAPTD